MNKYPNIIIKKGKDHYWYLVYIWENGYIVVFDAPQSKYHFAKALRKRFLEEFANRNSANYGLEHPEEFYRLWKGQTEIKRDYYISLLIKVGLLK